MNALCALAGTKYYQLLCILNLLLFGTQGGNLKYLWSTLWTIKENSKVYYSFSSIYL